MKYLLKESQINKFIEIENELITRLLRPKNEINQSDLDMFLFETNQAWWLAKGKTINISKKIKLQNLLQKIILKFIKINYFVIIKL